MNCKLNNKQCNNTQWCNKTGTQAISKCQQEKYITRLKIFLMILCKT